MEVHVYREKLKSAGKNSNWTEGQFLLTTVKCHFNMCHYEWQFKAINTWVLNCLHMPFQPMLAVCPGAKAAKSSCLDRLQGRESSLFPFRWDKTKDPTCWYVDTVNSGVSLDQPQWCFHVQCSENAIILPAWLTEAQMKKTILVAIKLQCCQVKWKQISTIAVDMFWWWTFGALFISLQVDIHSGLLFNSPYKSFCT